MMLFGSTILLVLDLVDMLLPYVFKHCSVIILMCNHERYNPNFGTPAIKISIENYIRI